MFCVGAMVLARAAPEAPGLVGALAPRNVSRPAAARPAAAIYADIGTPSARSLLASGFAPDEVIDRRSAARTTSGRALFSFRLAPDPTGATLSLLVRAAPGVAPHQVMLSINGTEPRPLQIPANWTLLKLTLPESSLASGRNRLEFISGPAGGLALDEVRIAPVSGSAELNVGGPGARQSLTKGWGSDETIGGRSAARLRPPSADLSVRLRPLATDYVLGVFGMSEAGQTGSLSVEVNGAKPGLLRLGESYGPAFVRVPRTALQVGTNEIKLGVAPNAHFAVDLLTLRPVEATVFIDVGTTEARQNLAAGFSVDEVFDHGTGAWSDAASSKLIVWLKPNASVYRMSVRASAFGAVAPLKVDVGLNGKPLGSFSAASSFDSYDLAIPAGQLREGQNILEFYYASTRQPSAVNRASRDTRHLALRWDWLEIVPGP